MKYYAQNNAGFLRDFSKFILSHRATGSNPAIISVFFPLLNQFIQAIPLENDCVNGDMQHIISPLVITATTMLMSCLALLSTFSMRGEFKGIGKCDAQYKALISLSIILVALIAYLKLHQIYSDIDFSLFVRPKLFLLRLFFEVPLLIAYTVFFSHLTKTLTLMALTKFYREN
ncbi:MAG: hypothetical protein HGB15_06745 [Chlorobaculum sp.]|nr:hypothetical protein [Chlorobaculum sp.]